jgi:hypothetical protein
MTIGRDEDEVAGSEDHVCTRTRAIGMEDEEMREEDNGERRRRVKSEERREEY